MVEIEIFVISITGSIGADVAKWIKAVDCKSSKVWPFRILSVIHYRRKKQREYMYKRDIQQEEEGKGLNRGTPEHLAILDVLISMVT